MTKSLNQLKGLVLCGATAMIVNCASVMRAGNSMNWGLTAIGTLLIIAICFVSIKIKELIPWKIPAFAWASLLALLLTTPWSPIQGMLLEYTAHMSTSAISTLILAVAGVSIGTKLDDIKKLSWKMVLIAIVVFCGTFFGSALIAQAILGIQGII